jgi:antitoxin HigA-1
MAPRAKEYPAGPRKVAPLHPGRVIAGILDDQRISVRAAARAIGLSHNALANVIAGKSAVTAEMALRIGTYLGNGAQLWLNLQQDYDLWHAERAMRDELGKIAPVKAAAA